MITVLIIIDNGYQLQNIMGEVLNGKRMCDIGLGTGAEQSHKDSGESRGQGAKERKVLLKFGRGAAAVQKCCATRSEESAARL